MKKLLFGCAIALCGLPAVVSAQDCYPLQYDNCCNDNGFDGFYIGGNIGVMSHTAHRNDLDGFLTDNSGWSTNDVNFTAGLQLGYDWQCCSSVFGLVWDWDWANTRHRVQDNPSIADNNNIRSNLDWYTTIRLRAGLTVGDALVYVTGGAAAARFDNRWNDEDVVGHFHRTHWGWAGGVGSEFKLGCNWSLGFEVLFLQFADHNESIGDTFEFSHSDSVWLGRVMLNYRFGDLCGCF